MANPEIETVHPHYKAFDSEEGEPRSGGFGVSPARKRRVSHQIRPEPRSGDQPMAHTYVVNIQHCVFSTKARLPLIEDPCKTWDTLRRVAANAGLHLRAVGGTNNHVHLLLDLPSTRTVADVLREIKANSSARIRRSASRFSWQDGYGAISVSPSAVRNVISYINHQQQHHTKQSFEDEYLAILERAGVAYDPQYVFG